MNTLVFVIVLPAKSKLITIDQMSIAKLRGSSEDLRVIRDRQSYKDHSVYYTQSLPKEQILRFFQCIILCCPTSRMFRFISNPHLKPC